MTSNIGCAPAPAQQVRPQTQVGAHLDEIERELERLDKSLALHAEKLQPVLRITEPSVAEGKCPPPEEVLVPAADKLRSICKRLTNYRLILEDMTERVEA